MAGIRTSVLTFLLLASLAPAGTPPTIVERLRPETVAGLRSPGMTDKLKRMAADVKLMSGAEHQRIGSIMKAASMKAQ